MGFPWRERKQPIYKALGLGTPVSLRDRQKGQVEGHMRKRVVVRCRPARGPDISV